jgi:hypothetical protein
MRETQVCFVYALFSEMAELQRFFLGSEKCKKMMMHWGTRETRRDGHGKVWAVLKIKSCNKFMILHTILKCNSLAST